MLAGTQVCNGVARHGAGLDAAAPVRTAAQISSKRSPIAPSPFALRDGAYPATSHQPGGPSPPHPSKCFEFQPNQTYSKNLPVRYIYTTRQQFAISPVPQPSFHKDYLTPDARIDYKMPHNPVHVLMHMTLIACDNVHGRCTVNNDTASYQSEPDWG